MRNLAVRLTCLSTLFSFVLLTNALVVLASLLVRTVRVGPAALDTLDTLTDLIGPAVAVGSADLLAHVLDAQLVGEAVGVGAADGLAQFGVTLERQDKRNFRKYPLLWLQANLTILF